MSITVADLRKTWQLTGVFRDIAEMTFVLSVSLILLKTWAAYMHEATHLQPGSCSTNVIGGTGCQLTSSYIVIGGDGRYTYHLPLTLIKQVIWGNSLGPSAK